MTKTGRELLELLRSSVSTNRDFLIGVLCNAETDAEKQEIIDYIKSTPNPEKSYIILMSIYRGKQRRGEMIEDDE